MNQNIYPDRVKTVRSATCQSLNLLNNSSFRLVVLNLFLVVDTIFKKKLFLVTNCRDKILWSLFAICMLWPQNDILTLTVTHWRKIAFEKHCLKPLSHLQPIYRFYAKNITINLIIFSHDFSTCQPNYTLKKQNVPCIKIIPWLIKICDLNLSIYRNIFLS